MADSINTTSEVVINYGNPAPYDGKDILTNLNTLLSDMDRQIAELEQRLKAIRNNKTILIQSIFEIAKKSSE